MSAQLTTRNAQIVDLYQEGYSMEEVARKFLISRERVRQILNHAGDIKRHYGAQHKAEYLATINAAHSRVSEMISTTSEEAKRLGITTDALRAAFRRNGLPLPIIKPAPKHGTRHYYMYHQCGCLECREANRNYQRSLKGREPPAHGTTSAYGNYGCRCIECRIAMRERRRELKQQRLEKEI